MVTRLRTVPDRPRRAIGYVRVSMAREEMVSPELQRAAIEGYCEQRGYALDDVIEELDVTGRNFARAGVIDAIERVERNVADVIVVWKVSRFGRTRRDWYVHADRVEVAGGSLESATEHFDPLTSTGRLTRGMLVELAAWESDVKSEQWKEAQAHRRRAGLPHTPTPRFGYVYDKSSKTYSVDPVTGPVLAECYARFIGGHTPEAIARWLNDQGITTVRGARWGAESVRYTLTTGFGAGLIYRPNKPRGGQRRTSAPEWLPASHPPVIDEATWRRFQRRRAEAASTAPRTRNATHPLTGLVVCVPCERRMHHRMNRSIYKGKAYPDYPVYACNKAKGGCGRCSVVESALWDALRVWLNKEVAADLDQRAEVKARQASKRAVARADRSALAKRAVEIDRSLARAFEGWTRGLATDDAYEAAREALVAEQRVVETRLGELDDDMEALRANVRPVARSLVRDLDRLREGNPAGLKEVLTKLVREIRVSPGRGAGRVEVVERWRK